MRVNMNSVVTRNVCVPCREVGQTTNCLTCGRETITVSARWRAPRKTNDRAWKRIERGEILWDRNHIEKVATKRKLSVEAIRDKIKAKRRAKNSGLD